MAGGIVRWYVQRRTHRDHESDIGAGTLFSSGLIAGGSLVGILYAVLVGTGKITVFQALGSSGVLRVLHEGVSGLVSTALLFMALAVVLARAGQATLE